MSRDDSLDRGRRTVLKGAGALGALLGAGPVGGTDRGLNPERKRGRGPKRNPGRERGPETEEVLVGVHSDVADVHGRVRGITPNVASVARANDSLKYATVEFPPQVSDQVRRNFSKTVAAAEGLSYVEENAALQQFYTPNDPYYDDQYAPQQVNCEAAWETTLGDDDVVVSVVDQGIQYDHPDLEPTMDARIGEDFVGDDGDPYPVNAGENHGTHVGGIAVGATDNGTGHAGISNCSALSARALDDAGSGSVADIADAIQWSADAGADVITLSLGSPTHSETLANACEYAAARGSLLVGAAGNDFGGNVAYPAAYNEVLAVSSLDESESLSEFSNTGPEIDLAAPGSGVLSAVPFDEYGRLSGTSMAAPVVAGVAGLVRSAYPDVSADRLREHLRATAVDVGLAAEQQGAGRVDAAAAVNTPPGETTGDETDGTDETDETDEPLSGACGDEAVSARVDGYLTSGGWSDADAYRYSLHTADPCAATVALDGPADATFDLYLTRDGRRPSRWDYDEASAGAGSDEEISVSLSGGEELGILVVAESGSGDYALTIDELGR
ncbi:S8 family serine peptidase [Natrinema salifodinae]|uniref:Serine protease n=1 Tax=Natrinema salifodinae TaxID=1202768 RepID=A0A1I0PNQ3_9EURY|nr:S8 family serine peptidase [Natrinema salifodinae]SEW16010.1 serine protease [Natrinema salifodinae]